MRNAGSDDLLNDVLNETIPMHGRMIHGKERSGELFQESQAYDVHGRVRLLEVFHSIITS